MSRWLIGLVLAAVPLSSGCHAPRSAGAARGRSFETRVVGLDRAVRTGEGVYYVETRYSDGSTRFFAFDPFPPASRRGRPPLRSWGQVLPVGVEVAVGSADLPRADESPCLRLSGKALQLREGNDAFQSVAHLPNFPGERREHVTKQALARYVVIAFIEQTVRALVVLGLGG